MSEHEETLAALREIRDAIRRQGGSQSVKVTKDTLETVSVNEAAKLLHTRASGENLICRGIL